MKKQILKITKKAVALAALALFCSVLVFGLCGCSGYTNQSLYPQDVQSICIEMFDNESFQRGVEYELTDALAKRIEAQTPYKIVSDKDRADAVISGKITSAATAVLTAERQTGRALEKEIGITAVVNWKNLRTGQLLLDNKKVSASAGFSEWQNQGVDYASTLAANKLAQRIVEEMEIEW